MIQNFSYVKIITKHLAKIHNLKNYDDWVKYTKTADFEKNFKGVIPKKPEVYYSKKNVQKRMTRN